MPEISATKSGTFTPHKPYRYLCSCGERYGEAAPDGMIDVVPCPTCAPKARLLDKCHRSTKPRDPDFVDERSQAWRDEDGKFRKKSS